MSNEQQPEHMRPIPDGGLKDAMPGWLKRPPAWRNMPAAEVRRERTLPAPDTSEIDPRALLDVNDLPQWLQTIAARGNVPVPEPDAAVEHAVEQVRAVTRLPEEEVPPEVLTEAEPEAIAAAEVETSPTIPSPDAPLPDSDGSNYSSLIAGGVFMLLLVIVALYFLL